MENVRGKLRLRANQPSHSREERDQTETSLLIYRPLSLSIFALACSIDSRRRGLPQESGFSEKRRLPPGVDSLLGSRLWPIEIGGEPTSKRGARGDADGE